MQAFRNEKPRIHSRPLLFAACAALAGAFFAFSGTAYRVAAALVSLAVLVCALASSLRADFPLRGILTIAFCVAMGALTASLGVAARERFDRAAVAEKEYLVTGRVAEIGDGAYVLDDLDFADARGGTDAKGKLRLTTDAELRLGDVIRFSAEVENASSGVDLTGSVRYRARADAVGIEVAGSKLTPFERLNRAIRERLAAGMGERAGGIAAAILVGAGADADQDAIRAFRRVGAAHLFAVSGLHVGFFAGILAFLFRRVPVPAYVKAALSSALLYLYSAVCAFTPSSLRAATMCSVSLFASASGEPYDGLNSLSFSALLLLLVRPGNAMDVGFRLSFSAALALILLARPLAFRLYRAAAAVFRVRGSFCRHPALFRVSETAAALLAVQIGTLPVSLGEFGTLSLLAIPYNTVLIPFVGALYPPLLVLSLLSLIGGEKILLYVPSVLIRLAIGAVGIPEGGVWSFLLDPVAAFLLLAALVCSSRLIRADGVEKTAFTAAILFSAVLCALLGAGIL